ncbi:MAG: patatin-like phospholipase family protein [Hyphomicrobiaceae bacterium]|nr:MAG: patatin-like phospholipase family protein [Hyphomicrobiaceae bacterium]
MSRGNLRLNLALQGGGAHGAFTWGVLDRLLEEKRLSIGCVSGTSAGAINAVALAAGFLEGGAQGARTKLNAVWAAIAKNRIPDFLRGVARASMAPLLSMFSPYDLNPLNFDPLRNLLNEHIEFDRLRSAASFEVVIAATDVATGRARLFRKDEITVECVLASACLPGLHHAVRIGDRHYWDGGFSANPEILSLAGGKFARDTLLVQLNPLERSDVPTKARDIAGCVNRITFNAPLLKDIERLEAVRRMPAGARLLAGAKVRRMARHRFHLIEASTHIAGLPHDSKLDLDKAMLDRLCEGGRIEADRWLIKNAAHVGRRGTVNLSAVFLGQGAASPLTVVGKQ